MAEPEPLDLDAKKLVLRLVSYGMYAVSAATSTDRGIFTANWMTQVSFDPPLLALSVERDSSTLPLILKSNRFAVSMLSDDQVEIARNLGRPRARVGDKFAQFDMPIQTTATGEPVLANSLGYVVCEVRSQTEAGDSVVLVGEVIEARVLETGEPLTMRLAGFRHAG